MNLKKVLVVGYGIGSLIIVPLFFVVRHLNTSDAEHSIGQRLLRHMGGAHVLSSKKQVDSYS